MISINKLLPRNLQFKLFHKTLCSRLLSTSIDCGPPNLPVDTEIVHFEDRDDIVIPLYPQRIGENLEVRKQRLLYQSRKRGMLENDLLLSTFAAKYLKGMNEKQIEQYDALINKPSNDWDIFYWATNKTPTPAEYSNEIMDMLKEHTKNEGKEKRFMPELK